MDKINLVIVDKNVDYLEFLTAFIRKSEYINIFSIKTFSSIDNLLIYLKTNEKVNILLIDNNLYTPDTYLAVKDSTMIFKLSETASSSEIDLYQIYKYQPLNNLFSKIFAIYFEGEGLIPEKLNFKNTTKTISVFSTIGGSGKTVFALNLAKQLAQRDYKVFYLSLEAINSTNLFFSLTNSYDFSKVIYYLQSTPKTIDKKLELYKKHDPFLKIDFFEPASNLMEVNELTKEDTVNLINSLSETGKYDYLVIDLDSSINGRLFGSLASSNYFFWLLLDNYGYLTKTKLLLKELTIIPEFKSYYERINFIQNESLVNIGDNYLYDYNIAGYLPFVPKWKSLIDVHDFFKSDEFTDQIEGLIDSLLIEL